MNERPHNQAGYFIANQRTAKRRKKRKKYTWTSLWAVLKYPIWVLIAMATAGYIVGGSWVWYVLVTR